MKKPEWITYGKLAWTEAVLFSPRDFAEDTGLYCKAIKEHSAANVQTLLHFGCGAGYDDFTLKKHFKVTGVDLSRDMLKLARKLNPHVRYVQGDMRTIKLPGTFDAVAIPDSIGYMTTQTDLRRTIRNAYRHLKAGGVLLIVSLVKENFKSSDFAYRGRQGDVSVTIFENNFIPHPDANVYEATFVYLIRRKSRLKIYTDHHVLGLFKEKIWFELLAQSGFRVKKYRLDHLYDRFKMETGEYRLSMFIGTKPL
jgi:SAM-dependent methyltransferase